jgi:putative ubiquitin-RnfH superfamily antitoxin RatB of RatAB toxin-antitoxin module
MARVDRERPATLRVAVAFSPRAGIGIEVEVSLPAPATVFDAVRASGVLDRYPELSVGERGVGIWGRVCPMETVWTCWRK